MILYWIIIPNETFTLTYEYKQKVTIQHSYNDLRDYMKIQDPLAPQYEVEQQNLIEQSVIKHEPGSVWVYDST